MGDLLAVNEVTSEQNVGPDRANVVRREYSNGALVQYYDYFDSKLIIVGTDGSALDSISAVFRYSWDTKGERIAYVTGIKDEESEFVSTGTWIYDVKTRVAKQIHAGGRDVAWAGWDGGVYVLAQLLASTGYGVLRYDPQTGVLSDTAHKGIYFSPDGRYYYRGPGEGDPEVQVFRTMDDEPVPVDLAVEDLGRRGIVNVRGWAGPDRLVGFSSVPGANFDYVLELSTGRKQRVDGTLMQAKGSDRIWILKGTSLSERSLSMFE